MPCLQFLMKLLSERGHAVTDSNTGAVHTIDPQTLGHRILTVSATSGLSWVPAWAPSSVPAGAGQGGQGARALRAAKDTSLEARSQQLCLQLVRHAPASMALPLPDPHPPPPPPTGPGGHGPVHFRGPARICLPREHSSDAAAPYPKLLHQRQRHQGPRRQPGPAARRQHPAGAALAGGQAGAAPMPCCGAGGAAKGSMSFWPPVPRPCTMWAGVVEAALS